MEMERPVDLQQVFIGFANFYRHFIQGFSRIAILLTAMLKTTRSSVVSAFRVDDNEVSGSDAGAESGGSIVKQKVGLIAPTKVPVEYANFAFSPDLAFKLPKHTRINDHAIELVDNHPSHPQVLSSFSIFLDWKLDGSLWLWVWDFNNLIIKNRFASKVACVHPKALT